MGWDAILGGLVNLGVGGIMAAAVLWLIRHLLMVTFPETARMYREELAAERDQRQKTREEFSAALRLLNESCERRDEYLRNEVLRKMDDLMERFDRVDPHRRRDKA